MTIIAQDNPNRVLESQEAVAVKAVDADLDGYRQKRETYCQEDVFRHFPTRGMLLAYLADVEQLADKHCAAIVNSLKPAPAPEVSGPRKDLSYHDGDGWEVDGWAIVWFGDRTLEPQHQLISWVSPDQDDFAITVEQRKSFISGSVFRSHRDVEDEDEQDGWPESGVYGEVQP